MNHRNEYNLASKMNKNTITICDSVLFFVKATSFNYII